MTTQGDRDPRPAARRHRRQGPVHQGARGRDGRGPRRPRRALAEGRADGDADRLRAGGDRPRARIRATRSCPIATLGSPTCPTAPSSARRACGARRSCASVIPALEVEAAARQRQHAAAQARRGPVRRDHPRRRGIEAPGLRRRASPTLIEPEDSLPAVGQGALAIECRADRPDVIAALAPLGDSRDDARDHRRARVLARAVRQLPHAAGRARRVAGRARCGCAGCSRAATARGDARRARRSGRGRWCCRGAGPRARRRLPRARRGAAAVAG